MVTSTFAWFYQYLHHTSILRLWNVERLTEESVKLWFVKYEGVYKMLTWASDFTLVDVFDSHIKEVLVSL